MKIIMFFIMFAVNIVIVNASSEEMPVERLKQINEYLKKEGIPPLGSGFVLEKAPKNAAPFKRPDIIERDDDNVKQFLSFENIAKHQYKRFLGNNDFTSSHLRHTLEEFNPIMAYTFLGAPSDIITKHIGYAPYVTYVKGKGWTGGIHFFKNDNLICRFSEKSVRLNQAVFSETAEKIGYEVNDKYTMLAIIGNKDSGFSYNVDWFDRDFFRTLECASYNYDDKIMQHVITLAKRIDEYQRM